jgi:hypothetical protein
MAWATLGFSGATHAHAHGNPCPQPQVQVSMGTSMGFIKPMGFSLALPNHDILSSHNKYFMIIDTYIILLACTCVPKAK